MFKVTPSSIGMLLECPKCLWLYVNEEIQRPRGIFPSLPSGMDEVFKDYFDDYRKKGQLPPEISGKVKGKLYENLSDLKIWRNNIKGFQASFPELEIFLKGAIDELMVSPEGKFIPFDFKTRGYPNKKDTHKHYQHQLDLYALLLQENGLEPADYGYLLFFWPEKYSDKGVKFQSSLVKMKVSAENGLKVLKRAHKIVTGEKPSAHEECEYCLYRADLD